MNSDQQREQEAIINAQQEVVNGLLRTLDKIIEDLENGVKTDLVRNYALNKRKQHTIK